MNLSYYDMQTRNRKAVTAWAKERGWETPSTILKPLLASLLYRHRLSLIADEIDGTIDRMMLLSERIQTVIEEGNLVALLLLKERQDEELNKLVSLQRLLDREGPLAKKDDNTDRMIDNAKQYPMEELLASYGCQVKMHRCKCPVHDGKNATSFEVKDNRGRCHSCGWSGDSIELVRKVEGVTFMQAVRKLQ
jgi:hypothetical protein